MKIQQIRGELRKNLKEKTSKFHFVDGKEYSTPLPTLFINGELLHEIFDFYDKNRFANQIKNKLKSLNSSISFYVIGNIKTTFGFSEFTPFLILRIKNQTKYIYAVIIDDSFLGDPFRFEKIIDSMPVRIKRIIYQRNAIFKRDLLESLRLIDDSLTSIIICIEHLMSWMMIILYDHVSDNFEHQNGLMKCMMNECFNYSFEKDLVHFSMTNDNVFQLYKENYIFQNDMNEAKLKSYEPKIFIIIS
jgi:hypothetical protein